MGRRIDPERKEKYRLIRLAYNYNADMRRAASCNSMYMGSMATCILYGKLGASWPRVSLTEALHGATDAQLDAGVEYCQPYLKYALLGKRKKEAA